MYFSQIGKLFHLQPLFLCAFAVGLMLSAQPAAAVDKLFGGVYSLNPNDPGVGHNAHHAVQNGGQYLPIGAPAPNGTAQWLQVIPSNLAWNPVLPTALDTINFQSLPDFQYALDWISAGDGSYPNGYPLGYLFMDIEVGEVEDVIHRVQTVVNYVRHDMGYHHTKIGNYGYYPGVSTSRAGADPTPPAFRIANRQAVEAFYAGTYVHPQLGAMTGGLTVAMPDAYPRSSFIYHADPQLWNGGPNAPEGASPNQRSAMFWAPLEIVSVAKRNLPEGHELIPWVTDYLQNPDYPTPIEDQKPTQQDNAASIQHYRLRGVDGYLSFRPYPFPPYSERDYRQIIGDAWHELNPVFHHPGTLRLLNEADDFATNKNGGIEWSAAQKGNRVMAVVSNLSGSTQSTDDLIGWADRPQFPAELPQDVAHGQHVLLQFRSSYLDNNNMERYADEPMDSQGANSWQGPDTDQFQPQSTPGSGNPSAQVVVSLANSGLRHTWHTSGNPGFAAADKVVYSAWLYLDDTFIGFGPANTTSPAPTGDYPAGMQQGPRFSINGSAFEFRKSFTSGGPSYAAVNLTPDARTWYEVQIVADGATGMGKVYVRDATSGQRDFTLLVFDDTTTTATRERYWEVPLVLDGNREVADFDGWIVRSLGAGNAIDNLNMGYYVPRMNDNFEHYAPNRSMAGQTVRWNGPNGSYGPIAWRPAAPHSSVGNDSNRVAGLSAGATNASAWWPTENPRFLQTDHVVYSAKVFRLGSAGIPGDEITFAPVSTDGVASNELVSSPQVGFEVGMFSGAFRFILYGGGITYQAVNLAAQADVWYDVQVQIDQTRDDGYARIWVKDLTHDADPVRLVFDMLDSRAFESLGELPLAFTDINNPLVWDGWQVFGSNEDVQIDSFRSFLFPYADFETYNLYVEDPALNTFADTVAQSSSIPEPASLTLLTTACGLAIRRRRVG